MSSLVFDPAALDFLLENPEGPVGQDLRRRAENITRLAQQQAGEIIHRGVFGASIVGYEIRSGENGLEALIGCDAGRIGEYLALKDVREGRPFTAATQAGLHT